MTVLFSRKCEYGLQALLYLAENAGDGNISADRLARVIDIPIDFIAKILQNLVKYGVVTSTRGKTGGFSLSRDPSDISLLDIVQIIDGNAVFESCVLGLPECGGDAPCPVHEEWGPLREQTRQLMEKTTLANFRPRTNT